MQVKDDGELVAVLKTYFSTLNLMVNESSKQITRFNQLMLTAYREFSNITHEYITSLRRTLSARVVHGLDTYAKRALVRNINIPTKLSRDVLFQIADVYCSVCYYSHVSAALDYSQFCAFISRICLWGGADGGLVGVHFIRKLFDFIGPTVSLETLVGALQECILGDTYRLFFNLHSRNALSLSKEHLLQLCESLLFILRANDAHLPSVSGLMNRVFQGDCDDPSWTCSLDTFKSCVETDLFLKDFFETGFKKSFNLEPRVDEVSTAGQGVGVGMLGKEAVEGLWNGGLRLAGLAGRKKEVEKGEKVEEDKGIEPADAQEYDDAAMMQEVDELLDAM